ncbi:hypothetical protein KCP78_12215 [Salmonella enterica subsp. enterica]|nr:hypothetical protein KCP78_12215 [Salmonella enterica subsp. enterica]
MRLTNNTSSNRTVLLLDGGINAYPAYSFPSFYAISLLSYFLAKDYAGTRNARHNHQAVRPVNKTEYR